MTKTQAFVGSLTSMGIGVGCLIFGSIQHDQAIIKLGIALLTGGAGWFALQRPADK